MPPPETSKSEIGSQSTMRQVQAGAYASLLTPEETKYSDCLYILLGVTEYLLGYGLTKKGWYPGIPEC